MSQPLSDNILRAMPASERKRLGKAGRTAGEIAEAQAIRTERELQEQCVSLLRTKGIFAQVPTFGRRTTGRVGWPDLTFSYPIEGRQWGIPCAWELKKPKCEPNDAQLIEMGRLVANGWCVKVIRSVEEMRDALKELEK